MNLKKNSSPVTIYDVAREAGVSDATVSRVFNNKDSVRPGTRERVLAAAQRLGYVANLQARSLAGGKINVIGLLIPGLDNSYLVQIASGVDQALAQTGYELMIHTTHRRGNHEADYLQYVANGLTEGILLVVPLLSLDFLQALKEINYPYVLIDEVDESGQSFSVSANNWQGAYDATEYLIKLGHQRIAFITGLLQLSSGKDRLNGYISALQHYGIPVDNALIAQGDFSQTSGYEMASQILNLEQAPTAIFASNDVMALAAMDAIRERGLQIPDDISLFGFDDIPETLISYPKLSTVHQPLVQMGQEAAKLLLEQIENPDRPPRRMTLATQLVIRDSCQALNDSH